MYEDRIKICESCNELRKIMFDKIYQCKVCSCILNIKARMSNESCPLSKWGEHTIINDTEKKCGGC